MKKIVFSFALLFSFFFVNPCFSQVGIGTMEPDKSAVLDVVSPDSSNPLGALIPRMTEEDRDKIANPANGLLIYNTDEGCINCYILETDGTGSWNSLCGGVAKSAFTVDCDGVTVLGAYMEGASLNSSNYLTVTVDVTKQGAYTLSATTTNGYGFNASGTFLNQGLQQVTLAGQGSPLSENMIPGDLVSIVANGTPCDCSATPTMIPVAPANPTFSMQCESVTVNGTYSIGNSLRPTNNITINVDVSGLGNGIWTAETNTVDGISFSGNGVFTSTGPQTITLLGRGAPTSASAKKMIITLNSTGISKTCTATVNCIYTLKKIAVMGYCESSNGITFGGPNTNTYGYELNGNRLSYGTVMAPVNFGTTPTSTVQVQGFNITGVSATSSSIAPSPSIPTRATETTIIPALANKPDIVIIGWGMVYSQPMIDAFINYLYDGGVMIIMNKFSNNNNSNYCEAPFFRALFGTTVTAAPITNTSGSPIGNAGGNILQLASISGDPILNGPFGNLNGKLWGNDYFVANYMTGIPADQIVAYSGGSVVGSPTSTGVTMFRHKTLNLFWVGDGGFISCSRSSTSPGDASTNVIMPFATDANYRPADVSFGNGAAYGGSNQTVCNARLFCNVLAWAIQQAENNGINAGSKTVGIPDPEPEPEPEP